MASEIVQIYRNEPDGRTTDIYPRTIASAVYITAKQTLEDYIKGEGGANIAASLKVFGANDNTFTDTNSNSITYNKGIVPSFSTTQSDLSYSAKNYFLSATGKWLKPETHLAQYHVASLQAHVNDESNVYGVLWFKNLTNLKSNNEVDTDFFVPYINPYALVSDNDESISACFVTSDSTGYEETYKLHYCTENVYSKLEENGFYDTQVYRTNNPSMTYPRGIGINIKIFNVKEGDKVIVTAHSSMSSVTLSVSTLNTDSIQNIINNDAVSVQTNHQTQGYGAVNLTSNCVNSNNEAWISIKELNCYNSKSDYTNAYGMSVLFDIYVIRR